MRIIKCILLVSFLSSSCLARDPGGARRRRQGKAEPKTVSITVPQDRSLEYAYIYNQKTIADLNDGDSISFGSNGQMSSGITHTENSSEIILARAGVYQVNFIAFAVTPQPSVALFLNGQLVDGGTYGSQATKDVAMQVIISVNAGDKLSVRCSGPLLYLASSSSGQFLRLIEVSPEKPTVNASIIIKQLVSQ